MIEIVGLTKRYGNNRGIKDLNFIVEKGEILGLLGPNGAGKSTTMNIITGYKPPTEGKVFIGGVDLLENNIEAKKKIGYLPEIPPLYPELRVISYLRFVCELKGVKREHREEHIRDIMNLVKISEVSNRLIKNLSKGYKQRVGLAQALISNPEVLILDEPTVGLDPKQIQEMRLLIKSLGKEHTVILSSHILAEVSMVCDRVVIIKNGEIAAIDTPNNLANSLHNTERFLAKIKGPLEAVLAKINEIDGILSIETSPDTVNAGFNNYIIEKSKAIDVKTPLFFSMANEGFVIHEMSPLNISLEDVFLELTSEKSEDLEVCI